MTLLALFKRPEGGDDAMDTFLRRYEQEHLPLIAQVPGLRETIYERVAANYSGDDVVVVTRMLFDDRATLDVGMSSQEMRAAGKILREIAPGLLTLVALEEPAGP